MPNFPFTSRYQIGRNYYGSSLESNQSPQTTWSSGQFRPVVTTEESNRGLLKFGLGLGALALIGKIPIGNNQRVWDKYIQGIRAVEEYSPATIFRTFQLSTILSPFESHIRNADIFLEPQLLKKNTLYREYLTRLIGEKGNTYARLGTEGVTFRGGKLFWGQGAEVALRRASAYLGSGEGIPSRIGAAYARSLNIKGPRLANFFGLAEPKPGVFNPVIDGRVLQVTGAQNFATAAYRKSAAIGTELVERFNRLLKAPFEIEPFKTLFGRVEPLIKKIPGMKYGFGVESTGGLRMLGKLSLKYGLGLGALTMGWQTLDYLTAKSEMLDETIFSEGMNVAFGSIWTRSNIAISKAAELTGLHAYREKQEEIAPGSTDIEKLIAFPVLGGLAASVSLYGLELATMLKMRATGQVESAAEARSVVQKLFRSFEHKPGSLFDRIGKQLSEKTGLYARHDTFGKIIRKIAKPTAEGTLKYKLLGKLSPVKLAGALGVTAGLVGVLPFIPGALIPSTRPDELEKIYSGEQEVAIRKGRHWLPFGRSPWEGSRIDRFRPHWYARMRSNAREKAIWGEDWDKLSPFQKWWRKEFTYELEEKHKEFPISSLPFEDVPLIGPVLASTIGRFIKPERLYRTDEWLTERGVEVSPGRYGQRVATEIGQIPEGIPTSPYASEQVFGEQMERLTDMVGLPGFVFKSLKERITGRQEFFDQQRRLESARKLHGFTRWYWDQEIGDPGLLEAWRRLYPPARRIPEYNPLRNKAPSWLPGAGERSPDFTRGFLYGKVPEGEIRLPGPGFAAIHPELEGIEPEEYPNIWRLKILADVAPYSDKYKQALIQVRSQRKRGGDQWTDKYEEIYKTVLEQVKAKRERIRFQEYQYLSPMGEIFGEKETSSDIIAALNAHKAKQEDKPSLFRKLFGGYWELLSHNAQTAWDQLTPISPGAKLVDTGTAIEKYERNVLYGKTWAFWSHPVRDFIAPFGRSMARAFGYEGVPEESQHTRDIERYFDILKYVKFTRLANIARWSGDTTAVKEFEAKKDETLFGVNPFTRDYTSIYRSLPRRERDYFSEFESAETTEERERILQMVPENEKKLYIARWKLAHAEDLKRAKKLGILTDKQEEEADQELNEIYDEARSEGFPTSKDLFAEYLAQKFPGETYPDWYRRTKILSEVPLPGPDFVGFHPSVDLEDVKLKLVEHLQEDIHEYDLWPEQQRQLRYKPFITDETVEPLLEPQEMSREEMRERVNSLLYNEDLRGTMFSSDLSTPQIERSLNLTLEVDREADMEEAIQKMVT